MHGLIHSLKYRLVEWVESGGVDRECDRKLRSFTFQMISGNKSEFGKRKFAGVALELGSSLYIFGKEARESRPFLGDHWLRGSYALSQGGWKE